MSELRITGDYIELDGMPVARILPGINASERGDFENLLLERYKADPNIVDKSDVHKALEDAIEDAMEEAHGLLSKKEVERAINAAMDEV